MFYNLHTTWQLISLLVGLMVFALISWRRPKLGAALVIFLAPLYLLKINTWPLTVLEALIWIFIFIWLAKGELKKEKAIATIKNKLYWPVLLIFAGVVLATIVSADWRASLGILKTWFLAPLLFVLIFDQVFESEEGVKVFLSALAASAGGVAAVALVFLALGRLTFDGRLAAFYLSPNHLAMWLVPGLIASWSWWFETKKIWQKILLLLASGLILAPLYFTFSYGAWLGLGAGLILAVNLLWRRGMISKKGLLALGGLLLILFLGVIFLQLFSAGSNKLIGIALSSRSSWQSRLMIWQSAFLILKDHWLAGIGPGLFQPYYLAYQKYFPQPYLEWAVPQPHNLFLAWWLQAGLAGLVGWLWLVVVFFRQTGSAILKKSLPMIFLLAVMMYFLVHGLVDTLFWKNDLALIWWLAIFLGCRAGRRVY